jgi:chromosome segregation ATPase
MKTLNQKKLTIMAALCALVFISTAIVAQEKTPQDNTRVKKQTPLTEKKQTRDAFVKEIKGEIKGLEEKIEKVKVEAVERKRDQTSEFNRILDALKAKRKKLDEQLNSFKKTSDEKAEEAKKEIRSTYKKLESEYDKLKNESRKPEEVSQPK